MTDMLTSAIRFWATPLAIFIRRELICFGLNTVSHMTSVQRLIRVESLTFLYRFNQFIVLICILFPSGVVVLTAIKYEKFPWENNLGILIRYAWILAGLILTTLVSGQFLIIVNIFRLLYKGINKALEKRLTGLTSADVATIRALSGIDDALKDCLETLNSVLMLEMLLSTFHYLIAIMDAFSIYLISAAAVDLILWICFMTSRIFLIIWSCARTGQEVCNKR